MSMTSAIEITVLATFFATVGGVLLQLYRWRREDEVVGADFSESWTCEYCGTVVEATTIENLIEGYRIHNEAIYCPGDEDDDERHYNNSDE